VAPTITPTPAATADSSTIVITSINNVAAGSVQVNFTATGSFPNGFKILYSKTTTLPTLSDNVVVISDGTLRTGLISGDPSGTYYIRVCKYSGSDCTIYSAVSTFTFSADTSTINITGLKDNTTTGYIDLTWTATGTFPNGFKLLYSTTQSSPTYENASSVTISNSAARTGTIPGLPATFYYLAVCKFTGTTCMAINPTNIMQYTSAQSNIKLINDPSGTGDLNAFKWDLTGYTGDTTGGYRLFYLEGKIAPTMATATNIAPYDTGVTTATIAGFTAGHNYVVRLCVWNVATSSCGYYSN
jgi:hypothetical protein